MKLLIAGSRTINIEPEFILALFPHFKLTDVYNFTGSEIVSGGCPTGPDAAAKLLQKHIGIAYYKEFPADWERYGKSAGPRRNKEMAEYSDALLLIWDGKSRGSKNMKENMKKLGKPIYEVILNVL